MRVHITTRIHSEPWGGGNQFLASLKSFFQQEGWYEDTLENADLVLFDSYQQLGKLLECRKKYPQKKIIYRLGPVFFYHRGKWWKQVDRLMTCIASLFVDGVVFQSEWSKQQFIQLGFKNTLSKIILNAPGEYFVFSDGDQKKELHRIPRLISMSWSKNYNKGFEFFQKLDRLIGEKKYEMAFIGNSPIEFQHIKNLGVQEKENIKKQILEHDIFVAPFRYEACSNAILEALACGLPVVALGSGGNKELVGKGGEVFDDFDQMLDKIDMVVNDYQKYRSNISFQNIQEIGQQYTLFFQKILKQPSRSVTRLQLFFMVVQVKIMKMLS